MKKFLFVLSLVTLSSLSYANDIEEDEIKIAEDSNTCCTATLIYNGEYVIHQESCYASFTYEQNCAWS